MLFKREGDTMATIQLDIPEEDRERFVKQAEREGKTLDAWLISVGRQHSPRPEPPANDRFQSVEELMEFLEECRANSRLEREPDWEVHLRNIHESRIQGLPGV